MRNAIIQDQTKATEDPTSVIDAVISLSLSLSGQVPCSEHNLFQKACKEGGGGGDEVLEEYSRCTLRDNGP